MVLQRVPENHEHIALGRLDALIDLKAAKTFGLTDDVFDAMNDGDVEFGLLAGLDLYVCKFEDHEIDYQALWWIVMCGDDLKSRGRIIPLLPARS